MPYQGTARTKLRELMAKERATKKKVVRTDKPERLTPARVPASTTGTRG